jgi:hypothetical protein
MNVINMNIENIEIGNVSVGSEPVIKCQLNLAFLITPSKLAEMREEINQESAANPGVTFEVLTQEKMRWKCSVCDRENIAPVGHQPSECRCADPDAKWMQVE